MFLVCFGLSLLDKGAYLFDVWLWNNFWMHSWNQQVISNEGLVSCSRKKRGSLMGFKLTTDRLRIMQTSAKRQASTAPCRPMKSCWCVQIVQPLNISAPKCVLFKWNKFFIMTTKINYYVKLSKLWSSLQSNFEDSSPKCPNNIVNSLKRIWLFSNVITDQQFQWETFFRQLENLN